MLELEEIVKEFDKYMPYVFENKSFSLNQVHYYGLTLLIFITLKELYIPKNISEKTIYFDKNNNIAVTKAFYKLAKEIMKQPDSYKKNYLNIDLAEDNKELEEVIWIINKLRDSICHNKFCIEEGILKINNNNFDDENIDELGKYKLKCDIPLTFLEEIFDDIKIYINEFTDFVLYTEEEMKNPIVKYANLVNQKQTINKENYFNIFAIAYFTLFFMNESAKIQYEYLDLSHIGILVFIKKGSKYIDKRNCTYKEIKETIDKIYKSIENYKKHSTESLKNNIINNYEKLLLKIKDSLVILNQEAYNMIRNGFEHVNINIPAKTNINVNDKKDKRNTGYVKMGMYSKLEELYNLTKQIKNSNLENHYSLNIFLNNLVAFGYPSYDRIFELINLMHSTILETEIDYDIIFKEYNEEITNYIKTRKS